VHLGQLPHKLTDLRILGCRVLILRRDLLLLLLNLVQQHRRKFVIANPVDAARLSANDEAWVHSLRTPNRSNACSPRRRTSPNRIVLARETNQAVPSSPSHHVLRSDQQFSRHSNQWMASASKCLFVGGTPTNIPPPVGSFPMPLCVYAFNPDVTYR
jgi:hypothetical protein